MRLLVVSILLILNSCKSKDKPVKVQIGPIPYNQNWRECKKASDCIYRQDECGHVYFSNKKAEKDLKNVLDSVEKQMCVDLVKSWPPFKLICDRGACSGIFIKE